MKFILSIIFLVSTAHSVNAGTLVNGEWTASKCGEKPAAPTVDGGSIDSFNKSAKAINEWQQQAKIYYGCLVDEANADNMKIADKNNREQADFKQTFGVVSKAMEAARKKLEE